MKNDLVWCNSHQQESQIRSVCAKGGGEVMVSAKGSGEMMVSAKGGGEAMVSDPASSSSPAGGAEIHLQSFSLDGTRFCWQLREVISLTRRVVKSSKDTPWTWLPIRSRTLTHPLAASSSPRINM